MQLQNGDKIETIAEKYLFACVLEANNNRDECDEWNGVGERILLPPSLDLIARDAPSAHEAHPCFGVPQAHSTRLPRHTRPVINGQQIVEILSSFVLFFTHIFARFLQLKALAHISHCVCRGGWRYAGAGR